MAISRTTEANTPEGFIMLGDLRRLVAETTEFDDSARVEAGMAVDGEDEEVEQVDTIRVSGIIDPSTTKADEK